MTAYFVSAISLAVIAITMLCRANDLRWRAGVKWQVRFIGFILCGALPVGILGSEWFTQQWPTWYEAFFRFGLMCVFVTTPYLPPWWRWISGKEAGDDAS